MGVAGNEPVSIIVRKSGVQNKDRGLKTLSKKCQVAKANLSEKQQALSAEALQHGKARADVFQAPKQK